MIFKRKIRDFFHEKKHANLVISRDMGEVAVNSSSH